MIPYLMATVGIGEILAIGALGNILLTALCRYQHLIFEKKYKECVGNIRRGAENL